MSARVNLLKPSEQRYQGIVGKRFAITVGSVTGVLLISLYGFWTWTKLNTINGEIRHTEEQLAPLRPAALVVSNNIRTITAMTNLLAELDDWGSTRTTLSGLLDAVPPMVPANMQLVRMTFASDWELKRPPAKAPEAPPAKGAEEKPVTAAPVGIPTRSAALLLEGRVRGNEANELPARLEDAMRGDGLFTNVCVKIGLQGGIIRDSTARESDVADLLFKLKLDFKARTLR